MSEVQPLGEKLIQRLATGTARAGLRLRPEDEELIREVEALGARLAQAQSYAEELANTQPDPYDNAFKDVPERVTIKRYIGNHLKEILNGPESTTSRIERIGKEEERK